MNKIRFKSNRYAAIVALLIAMFALSPLAKAQEPQGYAEEIDGVLTFYWDSDRDSRTGKTYNIPDPNIGPAWRGTDTAPNESITKVVFDPSFINCEIQGCYNWFCLCTKLTTIEGIEYLNTSKAWTMAFMFADCSSLTSLEFPNFTTGSVTNMEGLFKGCSSLKSVDISNLDFTKAEYINSMFEGCSSLTTLDLSKFDFSAARYANNLFNGCSSLTTLKLPKINFLYQMSNMFAGCSSLKSLDVSNFDTSNVTDMYYMFNMCNALTALDLSNFDTSKVTNMDDMFSNCRNLTSLDVSNFNTSNVTDMKYMFNGCYSLATLDLSSFDTSNVTFMNSMFRNCSALTSLDLSNFNTEKVTEMNWMFAQCYSLTTLNLVYFSPLSNTNFTKTFYDCNNLETIYCNYKWYSTVGSEDMFYGCTSLKGDVEFDPTKIYASMATPYGGYFTYYNGSVTEISSDADAPVEVYNLYGVKVADTTSRLTPGIYIVRQGKTVKKIAVK
ncbi:MAG: BspA family leucine-rich repeat surface protein [Candidatus Limisoma sp.]